MPYTFEKNQGQTDASVRYLAHGKGYTLFLTDHEAVMSLKRTGEPGRALRMRLAGSRAPMSVEGFEPLAQHSHYFVGNDPRQWRRGVPHFSRVRYSQVYPGIDIVYHSQDGQLEYDFVVAPGASADAIAISFAGAGKPRVNAAGDLELPVAGRSLMHRRPVAYQEIDGQRRQVAAAYELRNGNVAFRLGHYDTTRPLVIDPVVVYSSYIGGTGTDIIAGVAVDKDGNMYLTGETTSVDFPTVGHAITQKQWALPYAFVMKLNPAGTQILASTYIGGSSNTRGLAIALDSFSNIYLGGVTGARDFPLVNPVQTTQPGLNIGYVMKLPPAADQILFSTYIGGERNDRVDALAVDNAGSIYVTGYCSSTQFPVVNAFQPKHGGSSDAFVAKFAAPNYRVAYASFLGGRWRRRAIRNCCRRAGQRLPGGLHCLAGTRDRGRLSDQADRRRRFLPGQGAAGRRRTCVLHVPGRDRRRSCGGHCARSQRQHPGGRLHLVEEFAGDSECGAG